MPTVARFETAGGLALEASDPAALAPGSLEAALAALDGEVPDKIPGAPCGKIDPDFAALPAPLRDFVARRGRAAWRPLLPRIEGIRLAEGNGRAVLVRAAPGGVLPMHTHVGQEMTLVVAGGFADQAGRYDRGDLVLADDSVTHRPIADPAEGCLCYIVTERPVRFTGLFGMMLALRRLVPKLLSRG